MKFAGVDCELSMQEDVTGYIFLFHRGMNTVFWFWGFCTVQKPQNQKTGCNMLMSRKVEMCR